MVDPDTGEVDRETVFNVLRHHGVDVSPDPLQSGNTLMVKGTVAYLFHLTLGLNGKQPTSSSASSPFLFITFFAQK
jgi:hypothetical protein